MIKREVCSARNASHKGLNVEENLVQMASTIISELELLQTAKQIYKDNFNADPEIAACAPGRVNLIGEHTDYNDGFVLPMALPMITLVVGKTNGTNSCNVITTSSEANGDQKVNFPIPSQETLSPGTPKWANYIKGVVACFKGNIPGFDAVIVSSVPFGGGVSSSAALEVAFYTFLEEITGIKAEKDTDKALACQKAEHEFAGMPCGIMDQFISVMAKKNNALLIDCRSMEATLVPINNPSISILITNSNVSHELTGSEYSTRRKQCEKAAQLLQKKSLRDAVEKDIKTLEQLTTNNVVIKRARHVIGEINRTVLGAQALKDNDYEQFGNLMIASHNSLRDNFEVSCKELDVLVRAALDVDGVLGSRMTGGGFGGCTVTMVAKSSVEAVIKNIQKKYQGNPTFYVVTPEDGCRPVAL